MQVRAEYPRPNFVRGNWLNLNGEWEFLIDNENSGAERKVYNNYLPQRIIVPFCPESKLSGIENVDFMNSVWYAKDVVLTKEQIKGNTLLHFGACDYKTTVYINGQTVGTHIGGYTSFNFDVTKYLQEGANRIVVHAEDDIRSGRQPKGKQCKSFASYGYYYTRTTGIWQTVWLEFLPKNYIRSVKVNATNLDGLVYFETKLNEYVSNAKLKIEISFLDEKLLVEEVALHGVANCNAIKVSPVYLWNVGEPNLYDVVYTLFVENEKVDEVRGYFGIRRIDVDGYKVRINGKSVFQRLILDQGFYPDGIYTAPTDEDLRKDIELSMALGFNGARFHQKIFEERSLYHADRLGYLVWGEFANWGMDVSSAEMLHTVLPQWLESVERDYNHPSIIGWCPYNETWNYENRGQIDGNISRIYQATKAIDSTRPVIDTSGNYHTEKTDIYDVHDYEQNPEVIKERYCKHVKGEFYSGVNERNLYDGKSPYFLSEIGGIKWSEEQEKKNDWDYGNAPKTKDEFCERYCSIVSALLNIPTLMGFCYTQLTDVEQEQNGLHYYDRSKKFSDDIYKKIYQANTKKAKVEE